jgi:hypothetical protein
MCGHGKLYNKISLIESLLNREMMPPIAHHIKSLKVSLQSCPFIDKTEFKILGHQRSKFNSKSYLQR